MLHIPLNGGGVSCLFAGQGQSHKITAQEHYRPRKVQVNFLQNLPAMVTLREALHSLLCKADITSCSQTPLFQLLSAAETILSFKNKVDHLPDLLLVDNSATLNF